MNTTRNKILMGIMLGMIVFTTVKVGGTMCQSLPLVHWSIITMLCANLATGRVCDLQIVVRRISQSQSYTRHLVPQCCDTSLMDVHAHRCDRSSLSSKVSGMVMRAHERVHLTVFTEASLLKQSSRLGERDPSRLASSVIISAHPRQVEKTHILDTSLKI